MSMDYIRRTYDVPAKRGGRVRLGIVFSSSLAGRVGTIISAHGPHLRVRMDGEKRRLLLHPTWELTYLDEEAPDGC